MCQIVKFIGCRLQPPVVQVLTCGRERFYEYLFITDFSSYLESVHKSSTCRRTCKHSQKETGVSSTLRGWHVSSQRALGRVSEWLTIAGGVSISRRCWHIQPLDCILHFAVFLDYSFVCERNFSLLKIAVDCFNLGITRANVNFCSTAKKPLGKDSELHICLNFIVLLLKCGLETN